MTLEIGRLTADVHIPDFQIPDVHMTGVLLAVASAGLLAACSSGESSDAGAGSGSVDIAKISEVKSSFGTDFKVTDVPPTGIDKKVLGAQKLPEGMKFDPADCSAFAVGQALPADLEGNMAAVSAEGAGQRFIAIAMQTSKEIPVNLPSDNCKKVSFVGGTLRGTVEAVPAPQIDGVQTLGGAPRAAGHDQRQAADRGDLQLPRALR